MQYRRRASTAVLGAAWLIAATMTGTARNIAGYVRLEIPAGRSLVSVPFESFEGGDLTLGRALAQAPVDTQVFLFVPGTGYIVLTKLDETSWQDDLGSDMSGVPLPRGEGFWVQAPSAFQLVLHGQVPTGSKTVALNPGLQIVSYGFPTAGLLNAVGPASPNDGDQLYAFVPGEGYQLYTYVEGSGWEDSFGMPATLQLMPGQAYWYLALGPTSWTQTPNFTP